MKKLTPAAGLSFLLGFFAISLDSTDGKEKKPEEKKAEKAGNAQGGRQAVQDRVDGGRHFDERRDCRDQLSTADGAEAGRGAEHAEAAANRRTRHGRSEGGRGGRG